MLTLRQRLRIRKIANSCCYVINEQLNNDRLWKGRFQCEFDSFSKEGVNFKFIDKKTGYYYISKNHDCHDTMLVNILIGILNDVIVSKICVWANEYPELDTTDYRNISWKDVKNKKDISK